MLKLNWFALTLGICLNTHFGRKSNSCCCEIREAHKLYVNAIVIDTNLISTEHKNMLPPLAGRSGGYLVGIENEKSFGNDDDMGVLHMSA